MDIDIFLDLVRRRRNMRRFKPDPIPDEYIEKILEAARWAMSGANGQPWEFVVVKDKETRQKITDIATEQTKRIHPIELTRVEELRQPQLARPTQTDVGIKNAPVMIIVCGDPRAYQATALAALVYSTEFDNFHMSLANTTMIIHLAAAALGISSRWWTMLPPWEKDLKDLLGIPKEFRVYNIVPLGYPAYEPPPTYRRELAEIVHYDRYDQSKYRSDQDIWDFLVKLRRKTTPAYTIEKSSW